MAYIVITSYSRSWCHPDVNATAAEWMCWREEGSLREFACVSEGSQEEMANIVTLVGFSGADILGMVIVLLQEVNLDHRIQERFSAQAGANGNA